MAVPDHSLPFAKRRSTKVSESLLLLTAVIVALTIFQAYRN